MGKERELVEKITEAAINGTGMELFNSINKGVNYMSFSSQEFVLELKSAPIEIQNLFTKISLMWINVLFEQKNTGWFDGRNEYSCETGHKIYQLLEEIIKEQYVGQFKKIDHQEFSKGSFIRTSKDAPIIEIPKESIVMYGMSNSHRTLQQTFSGCVFAWLFSLETEDVVLKEIPAILKNVFESDFSRTPFI